MLSRVVKRVGLSQTRASRVTRGSDEHVGKGAFGDREKVLENLSVRAHEEKLINDLRAELQVRLAYFLNFVQGFSERETVLFSDAHTTNPLFPLCRVQKKDSLLKKAENKVAEVTGKSYKAKDEDEVELDQLLDVKKDLLKKIRELEDSVDDLRMKIKSKKN
jgi:hypothetical protein